MEFEAWLLDAYADRGTAVAWFVDKAGKPTRAHFRYRPEFYVSTDEGRMGELKGQIEYLTGVTAAEEVTRKEAASGELRKVLKVTMADTIYFSKIVKKLKQLRWVELHNTHLLHSQRVLFKLGVEPGSKALVDVSYDGTLLGATRIDDHQALPPPFKTLSIKLTKKGNHSIEKVEVFNNSAKLGELVGEPNRILFELATVVRSEDPDILICSSSEETLSLLLGMSRLYGLNMQLGRDRVDLASLPRPLPYWVRGRVVLDEAQFDPQLGRTGLTGILKRSRFGFIPMDLAAQWTDGRLIGSRRSYELLQRDYLVSSGSRFVEYSRTVMEMGFFEKGAMASEAPMISPFSADASEGAYSSSTLDDYI